jgi:hypothetical protein
MQSEQKRVWAKFGLNFPSFFSRHPQFFISSSLGLIFWQFRPFLVIFGNLSSAGGEIIKVGKLTLDRSLLFHSIFSSIHLL